VYEDPEGDSTEDEEDSPSKHVDYKPGKKAKKKRSSIGFEEEEKAQAKEKKDQDNYMKRYSTTNRPTGGGAGIKGGYASQISRFQEENKADIDRKLVEYDEKKALEKKGKLSKWKSVQSSLSTIREKGESERGSSVSGSPAKNS